MNNYMLLLGALILGVPLTVQAEIKADYIFSGSLTGNIAGAPDIEYLGNTVNYEIGSILGFSVDAIQIEVGTGLKLDLSQWELCSEYTLVVHGFINDTGGYKKLIDFRELNSDTGLYNLGGSVNYVSGQSTPQVSIFNDEYFQLVFSRSDEDEVNVYLDGEIQLSFNDVALATSMCFTDDFFFFVDDNLSTGEDPSGAVARITIYDHALTADEVGELEIADVIFFSDFETIELP